MESDILADPKFGNRGASTRDINFEDRPSFQQVHGYLGKDIRHADQETLLVFMSCLKNTLGFETLT